MTTLVKDLDLPELDFTALDSREAMMALLSDRGEQSWLVRTPMGYGLTRYADVVSLLRDRRFHSAVSKLPEMLGVADNEYFQSRNTSILSAEGDVHARLRRLVAPAFTPRATDRLRPFIRETISSLLDPITPLGRSELVTDVCEPYPIPIMCELLGAPAEDWASFRAGRPISCASSTARCSTTSRSSPPRRPSSMPTSPRSSSGAGVIRPTTCSPR